MLGWFYELPLVALYPITAVLIAASAGVGTLIGHRHGRAAATRGDIGTMTGAALGLLALLLAFSFSIALERYELRRTMVLEEANAIGSTANFALMLPQPTQRPVMELLREYTAVRIGLGVPYDVAKLQNDVARSLDLQSRLWQLAVTATAADPQSLPAYRFVGSLNEMNNIHERRLTGLRFHVPAEVMAMVILVAMVGMGFTGYHGAVTGGGRRWANLVMSLTVALLIMLIIDLDRPARGLILVPVQPLVDAAAGIPH